MVPVASYSLGWVYALYAPSLTPRITATISSHRRLRSVASASVNEVSAISNPRPGCCRSGPPTGGVCTMSSGDPFLQVYSTRRISKTQIVPSVLSRIAPVWDWSSDRPARYFRFDRKSTRLQTCLLYTSDAADEEDSVDP